MATAQQLANLTQEGGDRYADAAPVIAAIAAALEVSDEAEIREAFGMGDWRVVTDAHRARYAEYFAPRAYVAICDAFRRAIVGDYAAKLTDAEKAAIDAEMAGYPPAVPWDGVYPQSLLDEIEQEVEWLIEEGAEQWEIDETRQAMLDDWRYENGYDGGYTPEDLEEVRRGLIAALREEKKPAFEDLGNVKCAGFVSIVPVKTDRLWPLAAYDEFNGGWYPVHDGSLDDVALSLAGFGADFGQLPVTLPVDNSMDKRFKRLVGGPGVDDELPSVAESICAIRPLWEFSVSCVFEGSGIADTVAVNAFPGYALAHVREEFVIEPFGLYGQQARLVSRAVVAYIDKPAANVLVAAWGKPAVSSFNQLLMASYLGDDHLGRIYRSSALFGSMQAPEEGGVVVKGWSFDYPGLGADTGASVASIEAAFPRRQKVAGGLVNGGPEYKFVGLEWLTRKRFDEKAPIAYYTENFTGLILPPVKAPAERVRFTAEFARSFIDGINAGEEGVA